ncbi:MAG TPA: LmeA family phospholipid-binding protein [Nitriliruptorales bacterium]|nr:LmeA family phospholipid-binding protein [Nitriliruptorales bacterium]
MRLLRWTLLVVVLLVGGAEIVVPQLAEAKIEEGVRERVREQARVKADLGVFPVVTRYVITGEVPELEVTLREVLGQEVPIGTVRFALEGVSLDRSALAQRDVEVTDIDSGVVTAEIALATLDAPIDPGAVEVAGRRLDLGPGLTLALPRELVPCEPSSEVRNDRVVLTCTIDEVPSILVRSAT